MSKLYDQYLFLKKQEKQSEIKDNKTLFLFKSGAFFIFLDKDAIVVSDIISLKLTHLTENVVKCGFPCSALEKLKTIAIAID